MCDVGLLQGCGVSGGEGVGTQQGHCRLRVVLSGGAARGKAQFAFSKHVSFGLS